MCVGISLCTTVFQMMNTSYTSDLFASNISKECDILMGALYSVFCKSKTDNRNTTTVEKTHSPSTAPWPSPFNLHLSVFKSYCPLKGTASCYLLPTTGGPAWSQQSTSSSICPSVTLGWPSPYFHSQYLLLSATGVWKYSLFFPNLSYLRIPLTHFSIICARYCRWLFGEVACQIYAMCGVLFGLCSLTNLTALSLVCCLKVCFPNQGEGKTLSVLCQSCKIYIYIYCILTTVVRINANPIFLESIHL